MVLHTDYLLEKLPRLYYRTKFETKLQSVSPSDADYLYLLAEVPQYTNLYRNLIPR